MDKQLKNSFVAAVKNQFELYGRLKALSSAQMKILSSKSTQGLDEIIKNQDNIISEIRRNENEKKTLFEKMALDCGLKYTAELKLQDVLLKAGHNDAAEIESETAKLLMAVRENAELNMNNARLMKNFLNFTEFTADMKARMENTVQPLYTPEGIIKSNTEKKPKFDQKI
jgi:hypothetical protein